MIFSKNIKKWHWGKIVIVWAWGMIPFAYMLNLFISQSVASNPLLSMFCFLTCLFILLYLTQVTWLWLSGKEREF
jgi:hypothetical protein